MPTIEQVYDQLVRGISGGDNPNDSKWERGYVYALIPEVRATAICLLYNGGILPYSRKTIKGTQRINPLWQSAPIFVEIVVADQVAGADYLIFDVPAPVKISDRVDGSVYFGEKLNAKGFDKIWNRAEAGDWKELGYFNNIRIAYYNAGDKAYVYGNSGLKELWFEGVLDDPTQHPDWLYADDYPVSSDLLDIMDDVFKSKMGLAMKLPKDTVNDQTNTAERGVIKANLV